jgi:excisionase family DNA binding protein
MTTKTETLTTEVLDAAAAAKMQGYHTEYVRFLIRRGKIRAVCFGNSLAISRAELERYQRERMR